MKTATLTTVLVMLSACSGGQGTIGVGGYGITKADTHPDLGVRQFYSGAALTPASASMVLRDRETGSLWNLRGEAFSGPLADTKVRLRMVPALTSFWFAWSVFNHDTDIWTDNGVIAHANTSAIEPGEGGCDVPCDEILSGGPPKDGIPSVDFDNVVATLDMVPGDSAAADYLAADDMVLGVSVYNADGSVDARAYSHNVLWWHEIANDEINGERITISYCPLTGSGLHFPGGDDGYSFGTSGQLFNSNLVMYDRLTDSFWSQMLRTAITGQERGAYLPLAPVVETTWAKWRSLYPGTAVSGTNTDVDRDYSRYPYFRSGIDYRENDNDTFLPTNPSHDPRYGAKDMVLGVRSALFARAYPLPELEAVGTEHVINDVVGELQLAVVWSQDGRLAVAFDRQSGDDLLTFEVASAP